MLVVLFLSWFLFFLVVGVDVNVGKCGDDTSFFLWVFFDLMSEPTTTTTSY